MKTLLFHTINFLFTIWALLRFYRRIQPTTTKKAPPSPPRLPIIGNLHQIGPLVHRSFFSLSERYGSDLMLLHLGSFPSLLVSSAHSAREIMQTHDLIFASRATLYINKKLLYDSKEIAAAPYGEHWRQAKKIVIHHFLSNNKVKTISGLRDEEIAITIRNVEKFVACNMAVNLSDLFGEYSNSVFCRANFGRKYDDGEIGKLLSKILKELFDVFSRFYFVDYIPQLAWIDRIMGSNRKVETIAKDIDEFLELAIEERLAKIDNKKTDHELCGGLEPFIDELLRMHINNSTGFSLDKDDVKALLLDSYFAGLDTNSSMLEWVMVEILRHPNVLKKLQTDVRTIVDGKQHITDDDTRKMKYLKAVIMEATRLHPPLLPFPRVSMQDVNVMGFDIAKGTRVFINVWAIGRDPKVWDKPNDFVPERFLNGSIDFVMHDSKLLAFGTGRRSCPGRVLSLSMVENLLANLLYKFDWAFPDGVKIEDIDMSERVGLAIHKKTQLLAIPTLIS